MEGLVKFAMNHDMVNEALTEYLNAHVFKNPVWKAEVLSSFTTGHTNGKPKYEYEVACQTILETLANEK